MPYGTIKVDNITFTDNSVDKTVSLSGLIQNPTFTGNVTVTGTISGDVIRGGTTISGVTVTGTTANFVSGVFTTRVSGTTITGTTVSTTTGSFVSLTGTTATFTSGIIASGTAALPSLAILSDPNTGLFSPGADQVAISTNGSQRLLINSGGITSANGGVFQGDVSSYATDGLALTFNSSNSEIRACRSGGNYSNMLFYTPGANSSGAQQERMRITSEGLLGLGTSSPQQDLHINDASGVSRIRLSGGAANADNFDIGQSIPSVSNSGFSIYDVDATASRLVIDSTGNVGIGTTSPSEALTVNGRVQSQWNAFVNGGTTSYAGDATSLVTGSTAGMWAARSDSALLFAIGSSEKARIDSSGRLGIGNISPSHLLSLGSLTPASTAAPDTLNLGALYSSSAGANAKLRLYWDGTNTYGFGVSAAQLDYMVPAGNNHVWYGGGTERARIDSSGRLLVGTSTTSENGLITVEGNSDSGTGAGIVRVCLGKNNPITNDDLGFLVFGDSGHSSAAWIRAVCDGGWTSGTDQPSRLEFSTTRDGASSPTERMRITSGDANGGTFLFNCTSLPNSSVKGTGLSPNSAFGNYFACSTSSTGNFHHFEFYNPNGTVGTIATSASATAYNTSSDYRLKENIVQIPDAIDRLQQLKPSRFNFIVDPDKIVDGFIAHEAQAVVPECVTGTKDAVDADGKPVMQGIDQSKLVPLLTAALQEAIAKIESLETRLSALEAK